MNNKDLSIFRDVLDKWGPQAEHLHDDYVAFETCTISQGYT